MDSLVIKLNNEKLAKALLAYAESLRQSKEQVAEQILEKFLFQLESRTDFIFQKLPIESHCSTLNFEIEGEESLPVTKPFADIEDSSSFASELRKRAWR